MRTNPPQNNGFGKLQREAAKFQQECNSVYIFQVFDDNFPDFQSYRRNQKSRK